MCVIIITNSSVCIKILLLFKGYAYMRKKSISNNEHLHKVGSTKSSARLCT